MIWEKQPKDVLDYDFDFSAWLDSVGETQLSSIKDVSVSPSGMTIESSYLYDSNKKVKVWLSGGTVGETYKVTGVAVTPAGREKEFEGYIRVADK